MGVDTATYRQRVGCFRARAARERHKLHAMYDPTSKWDACTDFSWRIVIFTMMFVGQYLTGYAFLAIARSQCTQGLVRAFSGETGCAFSGMKVMIPGSTDVCYDVNLATLLLMSGDVECNPGPAVQKEEFERAVKQLKESMEAMAAGITKSVTDMMMKEMRAIKEELVNVSSKISRLDNDLSEIRLRLERQSEGLREADEARELLNGRVDDVEKRIEEQERHSRRNNVLLHGVAESEGWSAQREECEKKFVEVVNDVVPGLIQERDVVRAHRIGKRTVGKSRPIIACLCRTKDKMEILGAREELKKKGLNATQDLTDRQRQQLRTEREAGNWAYFKGGRLHVEPQTGSRVLRSHSRQEPDQQESS